MSDQCEHCMIKCGNIEEATAAGCDAILVKELKALLAVAACPANCTDGAYPDNYGEPVQCQFCYERGELLK